MANNRQSHNPTKREKREIAREKARILREQEEKRKKRNRVLVIIGGIAALALIIFAAMQILGNGDDAEGNFDGEVRSAELANVTDDYGIDIDGNGAAGTPVADAGVLAVYSDYTCSGCISLENAYGATYSQLISSGEMGLRLYPVATLNNQVSSNMTAAMFYVATYAPEQALAFNEALFTKTNDVVLQGGKAPTENEIADIAASEGVAEDVVADLPASIASNGWKDVANDATSSFRDKGYTATPTLEVNGEENQTWLETGDVGAVITAAIEAGAPAN